MYNALNPRFRKLITRYVALFVTLTGLCSETLLASTPAQTFGSTFNFARTMALDDPEQRISHEFQIPPKLRDRTAFWFDVYTFYGSNQHIIHHALYPWLIYRVADTTNILSAPGNRWVKYHQSERYVKSEALEVRQILKKLSRLKTYSQLSAEELAVYNMLKNVPGPRTRVFRQAYTNLRVQLGQKDFFMAGLTQSEKYLPAIESSFVTQGLPAELARLPFVESSFNVAAESKVGASGIWQIMPKTGKSYLLVNSTIDERNSPLKASQAAAQIFRKNFQSLKQWPLAVTAYNHGASGVHRALIASKTTNLPDLIAKYHRGSFRFASANFYTSFLAALHAEKYHRDIFMDFLGQPSKPINPWIIAIPRATSVKQLLRQTGLTHQELLQYNLDLKQAVKSNARLPRGYRVVLPAKTSS